MRILHHAAGQDKAIFGGLPWAGLAFSFAAAARRKTIYFNRLNQVLDRVGSP
jgi:hypothetical protein